MDALAQVVVWLNAAVNALGSVLLAPIALVPGWLSATLVAAATGIVMLVVFKHTSNQRAIKAARADIKANMLAMKLFKDNIPVTLRAQGRVLYGALRLLVYAVVPILVMAVPVTMLLAQLSLWYQVRPLHVGEEAVLTMKLAGSGGSAWPKVSLQPTDALAVTIGPVRVQSEHELCWNLRASSAGQHHLVFCVAGQNVDKEVAVGDGFMRVSAQRPEWFWWDALLYPAELPLAPDGPVQSIKIGYPKRSSWIYGSSSWVTWAYYWFAVSLLVAFFCRKLVGVNL